MKGTQPSPQLDSPLVVRIPTNLRASLERESARLSIPVSAVVRRILAQELLPGEGIRDVSPETVRQLQRTLSRIVTGLLLVFTTMGTWTLGTVFVL